VPRHQPPVTLTAGPQGATLLVCPGEGWVAPPPPPAPGGGAAAAAAAASPTPGVVPIALSGRADSFGKLPNVLRTGPGGLAHSSSALDLMTMMPPLSGLTSQGSATGQPPAQPGGLSLQPSLQKLPGTPVSPMPTLSAEAVAQPPPSLLMPSVVGRITEEEVGGMGRADSGSVPPSPGGAGDDLGGGPSRKFLLQPLVSKGGLHREKRMPFTGGGGKGGAGGGGGFGGAGN
jgi:hypothetical protein